MGTNEFKILLIDDDPSVNFLNKIIIEKSKIEAKVCERTEASEALSQISEGTITPNLILLDLNMPVMNGWEFLREYEQLPDEARRSKIIILSSTIDPADKEKASKSSSIADFLSKPLSISNLKSIMENFNLN